MVLTDVLRKSWSRFEERGESWKHSPRRTGKTEKDSEKELKNGLYLEIILHFNNSPVYLVFCNVYITLGVHLHVTHTCTHARTHAHALGSCQIEGMKSKMERLGKQFKYLQGIRAEQGEKWAWEWRAGGSVKLKDTYPGRN